LAPTPAPGPTETLGYPSCFLGGFNADALIVSKLPLTVGELFRAISLRPISIRVHLGRVLLLEVRCVFVERRGLIVSGGRTQVNA
jgi:hypothetical protein